MTGLGCNRRLMLYWVFGSFFLGISIFQVSFGLYFLWELSCLARGRVKFNSFGQSLEQKVGWLLSTYVLCNALLHLSLSPGSDFKIRWGVLAMFLPLSIPIKGLNWQLLHRFLLFASVPGMIFSFWWMLRPEEISWALKMGFAGYPRAQGFLSNPIPFAEGMLVLTCWNLARLPSCQLSKDRCLLLSHIALTLVLLLGSRVRSGLIVLGLLALVHAWTVPRQRAFTATLIGALILGGLLSFYLFGFNTASLQERVSLLSNGLSLACDHWLWGIGADHFKDYSQGVSNLADHPHNSLVGMAAEFGLPGLVLLLVFAGLLLKKSYKLMAADNGAVLPQWVGRALFYVMVCFCCYGLLDFNFGNSKLLMLYALHWGLLLHLPAQTVSALALDVCKQDDH